MSGINWINLGITLSSKNLVTNEKIIRFAVKNIADTTTKKYPVAATTAL